MPHLFTLLRHTGLYAGFELRRLWQTRSGLMTLAATLVIWGLLFRYAIVPAADLIASRGFTDFISGLFGNNGISQLRSWPAPELAVYWFFSLWLLPLLSLFFTANQLCPDIERGTVRFLTLRSSRSSLVLGRFAGQLVVQGCLILLTLLATLALASWRAGGISPAMLSAALVILLNLLLVVAPFTAIMALFSALVRSAKLAVSLAIVSLGLGFAMLSWFVFYFPDFLFLFSYIPGAQVIQLLPLHGWQTFKFAMLPLWQTALLLGLACLLLKRKAL